MTQQRIIALGMGMSAYKEYLVCQKFARLNLSLCLVLAHGESSFNGCFVQNTHSNLSAFIFSLSNLSGN